MPPYGTLGIIYSASRWKFMVPGHSSNNARTLPTIRMLREILEFRDKLQIMVPVAGERAAGLVQFDDFAHHDMCSVAYGKRKGESPLVKLIPDTYFYESKGYQATRMLVESKRLPQWDARLGIVFWRGSPSYRSDEHEEITEVKQIPRVALCEKLVTHARADVGLIGPWGYRIPPETLRSYFVEKEILRSWVSMSEHANYKYVMDIDGVANAWGLFDKLLMGSCVLKVESSFEQWYYPDLRPWEHYVPVRNDMSDLSEKIDWCFDNDAECKRIGASGQELACARTFDLAIEVALAALQESSIPLDRLQ